MIFHWYKKINRYEIHAVSEQSSAGESTSFYKHFVLQYVIPTQFGKPPRGYSTSYLVIDVKWYGRNDLIFWPYDEIFFFLDMYIVFTFENTWVTLIDWLKIDLFRVYTLSC